MLLLVNVVVSVLESTGEEFVYPVDAPAVCRIVVVIAGVLGNLAFEPL